MVYLTFYLMVQSSMVETYPMANRLSQLLVIVGEGSNATSNFSQRALIWGSQFANQEMFQIDDQLTGSGHRRNTCIDKDQGRESL